MLIPSFFDKFCIYKKCGTDFKKILPYNEVVQFLAGLALSFSPTPGVKNLSTSKANRILREQTLKEVSEAGTRLAGTPNNGTPLNDVLASSFLQ